MQTPEYQVWDGDDSRDTAEIVIGCATPRHAAEQWADGQGLAYELDEDSPGHLAPVWVAEPDSIVIWKFWVEVEMVPKYTVRAYDGNPPGGG